MAEVNYRLNIFRDKERKDSFGSFPFNMEDTLEVEGFASNTRYYFSVTENDKTVEVSGAEEMKTEGEKYRIGHKIEKDRVKFTVYEGEEETKVSDSWQLKITRSDGRSEELKEHDLEFTLDEFSKGTDFALIEITEGKEQIAESERIYSAKKS